MSVLCTYLNAFLMQSPNIEMKLSTILTFLNISVQFWTCRLHACCVDSVKDSMQCGVIRMIERVLYLVSHFRME